jgi:hypothetical protein
LADSVDLVDDQGNPMDRALLLEAVGSEEETSPGEPTAQDVKVAEKIVADLEASTEAPADTDPAEEG